MLLVAKISLCVISMGMFEDDFDLTRTNWSIVELSRLELRWVE